MNNPDYDGLRAKMVAEQLAGRGITDQRVLEAMGQIPRHEFVPPKLRAHAYEDRPVLIGKGQTISQPYIVAFMTQLLQLHGHEKVLEIGAGSGYQTAILDRLAGRVIAIERHKPLAEFAAANLGRVGHKENLLLVTADGSGGWPQEAPYDAILAAASAPSAPQPLLDQLADGGRMALPVGPYRAQTLQVWRREGDSFTHTDAIPVAFVPLRGMYGWKSKLQWMGKEKI